VPPYGAVSYEAVGSITFFVHGIIEQSDHYAQQSLKAETDERHCTMATYTVYFASRSILYAETKIGAETPQQALELAKNMADDEGGNLLDRLGGQYHDDPDIQVIRVHDESRRFWEIKPLISWANDEVLLKRAAYSLCSAAESVLAGRDGAMDWLAEAVKMAKTGEVPHHVPIGNLGKLWEPI
jgi:hypothetical protein